MIHAPVRERIAPILEAGAAVTCAIVDLEVLYSAKNYDEYARIQRRRELAYARVPVTEEAFARAIQVQGELARSGRHRLPIPDLIIAAVAESYALTVLHYDRDYDVIAEVTGQAVEWVVARDSIP